MDVVLKNVKKKDFPVLKSLAKSLGFEITIEEDKPYNEEFVKEIQQGRKDIQEGIGIKMTMEELDSLWK